MEDGRFVIGEYVFSPITSEDILKDNDFNIINMDYDKVFIAKNPMIFHGLTFWTNIYTSKSIIYKIELSNADEKYALNYNSMNTETISELRRENDNFLINIMGNPDIKTLSGIEYDFIWGKILSYYDNKSAEAGIVIQYC